MNRQFDRELFERAAFALDSQPAVRKATAHPFRSFFITLLKAMREASSMQTCTNSQPTHPSFCRRACHGGCFVGSYRL
jgi:hypothetical protein